MPKRESMPQPVPDPAKHNPLCISQLALVNHACLSLLFEPRPEPSPTPPAPPFLDDDDDRDNSGPDHGHGRRHKGHQRRHRDIRSPVMDDCCQWLKEVDNECVCDLLIRLPVFLARPEHAFSVNMEDTCSVTFECDGRIIN